MSAVSRLRERARSRASRLPILLYHRIADEAGSPELAPYAVSPAAFRRQMALLRRLGFTTVGTTDVLEARAGRRLPARSVWITFDDGYAELAEHALPVLRANGQRATVFVASALVGGEPSWDPYPPGAQVPRLLDWPQLGGLLSAGWEVEAHGREHRRMTRLAGEDLELELVDARRELEERLGRTPRVLSYPFGDHDARVRDAVERAGYSMAVSTDPGLSGADPRFALRRVYVLGGDGLLTFAAKVAAGTDPRTLVRRAR